MTTRIKDSLPELDLASQAVILVDAGDPGAIITGLIIHVSQDIPDLPLEPGPLGGAYFAGDKLTA